MQFETVKGKNKGKVILYGLSTCIWCKKTKMLLDKIGCEYKYIYVDQLDETDKDTAMKHIKNGIPDVHFQQL